MVANRTEIIIKTNSPADQVRIGSAICEQLRGNSNFKSSDIVVNYTDSDNCVYVAVSNDAKETAIQITA